MFNYEKRLEYPINIRETNPALAKAIITQYGGPNGELGASMRYLSQRYTMPYKECMAVLTDIGSEASEMFRCACRSFSEADFLQKIMPVFPSV